MTVPALPLTPALGRRLSGRPLVLFLDVDGTLSAIAPRPEDAVVADETKRILRVLASLPDHHVVIVTGRAVSDARRMVDVDHAWFIGNHGFEVAPPHGPPIVRDDVTAFQPAVRAAIERATELALDTPGVLVEDKRWSMSVHFRLAPDGVETRLEPAVAAIGRAAGLMFIRGKKVFELRPPIDINKGTAVASLAGELEALGKPASVLCAGDDRTDEDAFRALRAAKPDAVTVRVVDEKGASATTAAEFTLPDPDAMRELLERIVELGRDPSAGTPVAEAKATN